MNLSDHPLVSVLMPVYNVSRYIKEALDSILNQSYSNLEIVVVDDCSTDDTLQIVSEMALNDFRIKVYENKVNIKIAKTLNIAYEKSNGDYILRMDGDDISDCHRIEIKLNFLKENPEIDIVGCSINTIRENGSFVSRTMMLSEDVHLNALLPYTTPLKHIWLARRSVYDNLKSYRDIPGVEDYDFLLRAKFNGFKYTNISDYYGYSVRIGREGSTISTLGYKQLILRKMVYKDFCDGYTCLVNFNNINSNYFFSRLYAFSARRLSKAIYALGQNSFFEMAFNLICCLFSPHMVSYLFERVYINYYFWKNKL